MVGIDPLVAIWVHADRLPSKVSRIVAARLGDADADTDALGLTERLADADGLTLADADADGETEALGLTEADADADGETLADGGPPVTRKLSIAPLT